MIWPILRHLSPFGPRPAARKRRRRNRPGVFRRPLLEVLEDRLTPAPIPTVTVPASTTALLGSPVALNLTFDNTGNPGDVGYGPYIDLFLDTNGPDGGATPDGFTTAGLTATYLGLPQPAGRGRPVLLCGGAPGVVGRAAHRCLRPRPGRAAFHGRFTERYNG